MNEEVDKNAPAKKLLKEAGITNPDDKLVKGINELIEKKGNIVNMQDVYDTIGKITGKILNQKQVTMAEKEKELVKKDQELSQREAEIARREKLLNEKLAQGKAKSEDKNEK